MRVFGTLNLITILCHKSLYILISNVCQGFSLYLFGEIVSSDKEISSIPSSLRELSNNVQPPLDKRPRAT